MNGRPDPGGLDPKATRRDVTEFVRRLEAWTASSGHHLNPDTEMVVDLAAGLLANERRYGTMTCPCRIADGRLSRDLDIICPCDYRDADIAGYGNCFCGLFVSEAALRGEVRIGSIPERRRSRDQIEARAASLGLEAGIRSPAADDPPGTWRCTKCGYLCDRGAPPLHCPVCLADQNEFEPAPDRS